MAKTKLHPQSDFDAVRFVSIWLGNFASDLGSGGLDDYYIERFEGDYGFRIYPPAGPECCVIEEGGVPVRKLLDGFSLSATFIDAAVDLCISEGWYEATTAMIFLHMKYDPSGIEVNPLAPMKFIGSVPMTV